MPHDNDDSICNSSNNETFQDVVDQRVSRRNFIAAAGFVSMGGVGALLNAMPSLNGRGKPLLGFERIPVSSADCVGRSGF